MSFRLIPCDAAGRDDPRPEAPFIRVVGEGRQDYLGACDFIIHRLEVSALIQALQERA